MKNHMNIILGLMNWGLLEWHYFKWKMCMDSYMGSVRDEL